MKITLLKGISKEYKYLIIIILICIIAPIFFQNILSNIIIGDSGDPIVVVYSFSKSFKYYNEHGYQSIIYNNYINYPFGEINKSISQVYDFLTYFVFYKTFHFNPIFIYNYLIILSFPLTFFTTFLLSKYLFKKNTFATFSALIFTFSNYRIGESLLHLSLANTQWIPLFFLSLLLLNEKQNFKYSLLAAVSFLLIFLCDSYYAYFSIFFIMLFFIYNVIQHYLTNKKFDFNFIKYFGLFIAISLALIAPFLYNAFFVLVINTQTKVVRPIIDLQRFSINILNFLFPTKPYLLNIAWYSDFLKKIGATVSNNYIGILTIFISFFAVSKLSKSTIKNENTFLSDRKWSINTLIIFLIINIFFMIIIGLPPTIKPFGIEIKTLSNYIYKIFPTVRVYERTIVYIWLSISLLFPIGLISLFEKLKRKYLKILLACIVVPIILFDFSYKPVVQTNINKIPDNYIWLIRDKSDFAISEFEIRNDIWLNYMNYERLYYQQFHNKKIFNSPLLGTEDEFHKSLNDIKSITKSKILGFLGVKYATVECKNVTETIQNLEQNNNIELQYSKNNNLIYRIKNYIERPDIYIPKNIIFVEGELLSYFQLFDFNDFNKDSVFVFSELEKNKNSALNNSDYIIIPVDAENIEDDIKIDNYSFKIVKPILIKPDQNNGKTNISLSIINSGSSLWINDTDNPVKVGYKIFKILNNQEVQIDESRCHLTKYILPGETTDVDINLNIPKETGDYRILINLLKENEFWFNNNEINIKVDKNFSEIEAITYPKVSHNKNKINYLINVPINGEYNIIINRKDIYSNGSNTKIKIDDGNWEQINPDYINMDFFDDKKQLIKKVYLTKGTHKIQFSNIDFLFDKDGKRLTNSFSIINVKKHNYTNNEINFVKNKNGFSVYLNKSLKDKIPIFINLPYIWNWKFNIKNETMEIENNIGNGYGLLFWLPVNKDFYSIQAYY